MAIIHKPFKYVPAAHTDIRKTIQREYARLRAQEEAKHAAGRNVTELKREKERRRLV